MVSGEEKKNLKLLGRNIRRLREKYGWSQEELAYRCGLHRTYVGAVERGERNIGALNIFKIGKAFGVDAGDLLRE